MHRIGQVRHAQHHPAVRSLKVELCGQLHSPPCSTRCSDAASGGDIVKLPLMPTVPPMLLNTLSARCLCMRCDPHETAATNMTTCESTQPLTMIVACEAAKLRSKDSDLPCLVLDYACICVLCILYCV